MYRQNMVWRGGKRTIPIPKGMDYGILIGKKGSNIQFIRGKSGAHCNVDSNAGEVVVTGSASSVEKAVVILEKQISASQTRGSARQVGEYPHPQESHLVFGSSFEETGLVTFLPSSAPKEEDTVSNTAYEAQPTPSSSAPPRGDSFALNALSARMSATTLTSSSFHAAREKEPLLKQLLAAEQKALDFQDPPFSQVKVRFNVGTQFFYKAPKGAVGEVSRGMLNKTPVRFNTLRTAKVGYDEDLKLSFTNHVARSVSDGIEAHLCSIGFRHVDKKQHVSLHVKDVENFTSVNLSFRVSDVERRKKLEIRKVKTGTAKLFFLSVVNPAGQPDYRLKLLAQYDLPENEPESSGPEVWKYARACTWMKDSPPFVQSSASNAFGFVVDKARYKTKRVFEGSLSEGGPVVRVTFSEVRDENGSHLEVAGAVPAQDDVLCTSEGGSASASKAEGDKPAVGSAPARDEADQTAVKNLEALVAFCELICAVSPK